MPKRTRVFGSSHEDRLAEIDYGYARSILSVLEDESISLGDREDLIIELISEHSRSVTRLCLSYQRSPVCFSVEWSPPLSGR